MKYIFNRSPHPYLCFASCLRTVIEGYCGIVTDEFDIGNELGVITPDAYESKLEFHSQSNLSTDWGVNVDTVRINSVLTSYQANLECKYHSAKMFEDYAFDDFVQKSLKGDNMIILGFDYNYLFKMSATEIIGHAAVGISTVDKPNGLGINIFDPGPRLSAQKQVDSFDMYVACKRKGGGVWTFNPTK
jgi:hypothetical protein